jgi:quinol monooxygenase YgiN
MPFFVAVHHDLDPGRLDERIAAVRSDFARSPLAFPGRRFARVFAHLHEPTRLLGIEEWRNRDEFERHQASPSYLETLSASGPSPRSEALERLQYYRHLPHRPAALACTGIVVRPEWAGDVESFICDDQRRDVLITAGLVLRAVYRVAGSSGHLLVLHGWRSLEHLERYLGTLAVSLSATLAEYDATLDQFAGRVVAEYSWLDA